VSRNANSLSRIVKSRRSRVQTLADGSNDDGDGRLACLLQTLRMARDARRAALAIALAVASATPAQAADGPLGAPGATPLQRGDYLARAGDCISCHTAPGGRPFAGGYRVDTPFGPLFAPNIMPDQDTGIARGQGPPGRVRLRPGQRRNAAGDHQGAAIGLRQAGRHAACAGRQAAGPGGLNTAGPPAAAMQAWGSRHSVGLAAEANSRPCVRPEQRRANPLKGTT
jgi:hypothetical protein